MSFGNGHVYQTKQRLRKNVTYRGLLNVRQPKTIQAENCRDDGNSREENENVRIQTIDVTSLQYRIDMRTNDPTTRSAWQLFVLSFQEVEA